MANLSYLSEVNLVHNYDKIEIIVFSKPDTEKDNYFFGKCSNKLWTMIMYLDKTLQTAY